MGEHPKSIYFVQVQESQEQGLESLKKAPSPSCSTDTKNLQGFEFVRGLCFTHCQTQSEH